MPDAQLPALDDNNPAVSYPSVAVEPPPATLGSTAVRFQFDRDSIFDAQALNIDENGVAGTVLTGFGAGFSRVRRAALGSPAANGCYALF